MKKIVFLKDAEEREKRFLELLFDEKRARGVFFIPKEAIQEAGGKNRKIRAKRQYEWLLRLADFGYAKTEEWAPDAEDASRYVRLSDVDEGSEWDGICADCYIISKYKDRLLANGCFDVAAESVLCAADAIGRQQEAAACLESMLRRGAEYDAIDDDVQPILLYKGEAICHNVLNVFAEQFGAALAEQGNRVEYFDLEEGGADALTSLIGRHFKAVIGMQTWAFSVKMKDQDVYLHDLVHAPLYNFVFDHPIWVKRHLMQSPRKLSVLTLDRNYLAFVARYYKRKAFLLPPAGCMQEEKRQSRRYDVSFVGVYGDYLHEVLLIHQMERKLRFLANRFLLILRRHPNLAAEAAFHRTLQHYGIIYEEDTFLELFYEVRRTVYCAMHYYRYRVIKALLDGGIRVDVFGDSWKGSPLYHHPNLICHADVTPEESAAVFSDSKLSLNVMSWHKRGFTERMAGILLCGAVLVTDATAYLEGSFRDGEDLIVFDLAQSDRLPERIRAYLNAPEQLEDMAKRGRDKAEAFHTWDCRAEEFLKKIMEGGNEWTELEGMLLERKTCTKAEYYAKFGEMEQWLLAQDTLLTPRSGHRDEIAQLCDILTSGMDAYPVWMKVHLLSFCMKCSEEKTYAEWMIKEILESDDDALVEYNKYFLYWQVSQSLFINQNLQSAEVKKGLAALYRRLYDAFYHALGGERFSRIPIEERNQNLVYVFVSQFLTDLHGPTKTTLDRAYCLWKDLGKEVVIVNTAMMQVMKGDMAFYNRSKANYLPEHSSLTHIRFRDAVFSFYQCKDNMPDLYVIGDLMCRIAEEKPYCIVTIGAGGDLCADLCGAMVPEITVGTVPSESVVTTGTFQLLERELHETDYAMFQTLGIRPEHAVKALFTYVFKEQTKQYEREELELPEHAKLLLVTGWRLDQEVTEAFLQMLDAAAAQEAAIEVVFMGRFNSFEQKVSAWPQLFAKSHYLEDQSEALAVMECCDIYVNPYRRGGGTSSAEALYKGIPVVTLAYGDVSEAAGTAFQVENYEAMKERILRYCREPGYYEAMSEAAKKRAALLTDSRTHFVEAFQKIERMEAFR